MTRLTPDQETIDSIIVGTTLKSDYRKPTSTFLITRVYYRNYPDGNQATRWFGYMAEYNCVRENDLDARSALRMFPYLHNSFADPEPERTPK